VSDLFGTTGRHWLSRRELHADERSAVQALLRQLDYHGTELAMVDRELAAEALADPVVARLMTIPAWTPSPQSRSWPRSGTSPALTTRGKLVAYVGLNPKVRQSGNSAAVHGRISKAGRPGPRRAGRGGLVSQRAPGPLRAFYQRVKGRHGFPTAVVATARKMSVLAWQLATKDQDYAFARPALVTHKRRKLELAAGAPSRRGNHRRPGAVYNDRQRRNEEAAAAERAERAYELLVATGSPGNQPAPQHGHDDFIRRA
jgi:transposase